MILRTMSRLGSNMAFMNGLVCEHRLSDNVTDSENMTLIGSHLAIDRYKSAFVVFDHC